MTRCSPAVTSIRAASTPSAEVPDIKPMTFMPAPRRSATLLSLWESRPSAHDNGGELQLAASHQSHDGHGHATETDASHLESRRRQGKVAEYEAAAAVGDGLAVARPRSEEHTSELQS